MKNKELKKARLSVLLYLLAATIVTVGLVILLPHMQLKKGTALINEEQYEKAYKVLDHNYLKAAKKMKILAKAGIYFEDGNYRKGTNLITSINGSVDVFYDFNGGEYEIDRETIKKGDNIDVVPNLYGYKLSKYDVTDFLINTATYSADLNLKAIWAGREYRIYVFTEDEEGWLYQNIETVTYGEPYSFDYFEIDGKNFSCWKDYYSDRTIPKTGIWTYTDIERIDSVYEWKTIELGSYPQSLVKESNIISSLNSLAGELPTSDNSYSWTSYKYFKSNVQSDFYWYKDVYLNGDTYRGVYFTSYRPYYIGYDDATVNLCYENTFETFNTYWFKYEPIKWIQFNDDDSYFLMSLYALDSTNYHNKITNSNNNQDVHYSSSSLRSFVTNDFYSIAFSDDEKEYLLTNTVNNSVDEKYNTNENYASKTTYDKVFIPSCVELDKYVPNHHNLCAEATEYALSQGIGHNLNTNDTYYVSYHTRTPLNHSLNREVTCNGFYQSNDICYTNIGVRPCIRIGK